MADTSKELLDCMDQPRKPSLAESLLLINKDPSPKTQQRKPHPHGPLTTALPTSQVLGKVKDFLGVMAKANEKLELDVQENPRSDFDIEILDENKEEYIEMDLLLGVADLHTAEAVSAAEATMGSFQPSKSVLGGSGSSSSSDTEDDSENDDDDDDDDNGITLHQEKKLQRSNSNESSSKNRPNKRPKIVVLN